MRPPDYSPSPRAMDRTWIWCILRQGHMCSYAIVIAHVVGDDSPQVTFPDDDRVIQTFSPHRPDHALNVWILPWRTGCSSNFDQPKCRNFLPEHVAVNCVVVTKQILGCIVCTDGLKHLPRRPYRSGMFCCVSVNNFSPIMAKDHQDKEHSERCRGYCEEVDCDEIRRMDLEESSPCLRRWLPISNHVLGHHRFRHIDAELQQLTVDPRRTPQRIGRAHAANEGTNVRVYRRTPTFSTFECPIPAKSVSVPADYGFRPDDM